MLRLIAVVTLVLSAAACRDEVVPELPEDIAGRCRYVNRFSDGPECRDYLGPWAPLAAQDDCAGQGGAFEADARCDRESAVGSCVLNKDADTPIRVAFEGGTCGENERGCELFGGGVFLADGACGAPPVGPEVLSNPFPEPEQSCVAPLEGDEAGAGPSGSVCQWITMQGCTEEGRTWEDYGSCEVPRAQRPYYPVPTADDAERADPRLQDPAYAAELGWVKSQLSSCSCVCCHSTSSPEGPANWYLEQPGNFINGMFDTGVAQGAGVISSDVLGDIEPEQNNGFTRLPSIFPSTDPARMQAFFARELEHRGLTSADFDPTGFYGPLSEQDEYTPVACGDGVGVDSEGVVRWTGGAARLVYVLESGSQNPGVPPNRDTPVGTLWRIDAIDPRAALIDSGVVFGVTPATGRQRVPSDGPPSVLVSGQTYLLYVSADYMQPVARCTFVAP